ncbi:MAG: hypothetical protein ACAH17_02065, partial [Candidatus Paceibacterota bacterium]
CCWQNHQRPLVKFVNKTAVCALKVFLFLLKESHTFAAFEKTTVFSHQKPVREKRGTGHSQDSSTTWFGVILAFLPHPSYGGGTACLS